MPRGAEEDEAPPALLTWFGERIPGHLREDSLYCLKRIPDLSVFGVLAVKQG